MSRSRSLPEKEVKDQVSKVKVIIRKEVGGQGELLGRVFSPSTHGKFDTGAFS